MAASGADISAAAPVSGRLHVLVAAPLVVSRSGQTGSAVLLPAVVAGAQAGSRAVLAGSGA